MLKNNTNKNKNRKGVNVNLLLILANLIALGVIVLVIMTMKNSNIVHAEEIELITEELNAEKSNHQNDIDIKEAELLELRARECLKFQDMIAPIKDVNKKSWFILYKNMQKEYSEFGTPIELEDCYTPYEILLLYKVVQAEIGDYSFDQKVNVASVIFNRIESDRFPNDLKGVLTADQFATIKNNRINKVKVTEETIMACKYAFEIEDTTNGALFFDSNKALEKSCKFMFNDSAHNFYTIKD